MTHYIPYFILGIPLAVFLCQFKHGKLGGFQFISTASLTALLLLYFLFHSGIIGEYVVKLGDKEFYVSPSAFERLISKNIENFGKALAQANEKYFKYERFYTADTSRVSLSTNSNGRLTVGLHLATKPVWSTVRITPDKGTTTFNPEDPSQTDKTNNILFQSIVNLSPSDALNEFATNNTYFDVSYFQMDIKE